jgi:hypothetical protein
VEEGGGGSLPDTAWLAELGEDDMPTNPWVRQSQKTTSSPRHSFFFPTIYFAFIDLLG